MSTELEQLNQQIEQTKKLQEMFAQMAAQQQRLDSIAEVSVGSGTPRTTPFEDRALPLIARGIPVVWVPPRTKAAILPNWQEAASTDPVQIKQWGQENPDANTASVAKAQLGGVFFLEIDKPGFHGVIEEQTGKKIPKTFAVSSRPGQGRGHFYFRHTPQTIALAQKIGKAYLSGKDENGHEAWSLRWNNSYVIGPMSVHPDTGKLYEIVPGFDVEIADGPIWLVEWCVNSAESEKESKKTGNAELDDDRPIPQGQRNNTLTSIAGKARQVLGMDKEELFQFLLSQNQKRCKPPLPESEVRTIANSVGRYEVKPAPPVIIGGRAIGQQTPVIVAAAASEISIDLSDESRIPEFDESVITGIYRDIVDVAVGGTTVPRQFAFLAAKTYMGARMAGKVTFEGLESDSSYYAAAIGVTGTSKRTSWDRTFEKVLTPQGMTEQLKLIYSADSGAGLKDAFFEPPDQLPVVCFIDEVTTLGHKAGEKKNPEILDTMVELADSHRISRVKAKHGKEKSVKTHDNARLSVFMCGQDGPAYMGSYAGRTKLGWFDRLYPEFSEPVEAGDLPEIDTTAVANLHGKLVKLNFHGKMTMSAETKSQLDTFWKSQPGDIRRKVRFKKYLMLDMYMAAFGRGLMVADPEDLDVAIKIFKRQIVIRQVMFTSEVPDRIGFYISKIKAIVEAQRKELNSGKTMAQVAKSLRDFQTMTNAFRDNELHTFERAWKSMSEHVVQVSVKAGNGQTYQKWVPRPYEDEMWLLAAA